MNPPQISALIFFIIRLVEGYIYLIPDPNLQKIVDLVCKLAEAITIYLIAQGVIVAVRKAGAG